MIDDPVDALPAIAGSVCSTVCPACRQPVLPTSTRATREQLEDQQVAERLAIYLGCSVVELRRALRRLLADKPDVTR